MPEVALAVGGAALSALVAIVGTVATWRALGNVGLGLREARERITNQTEHTPVWADTTRQQLESVRAGSERALWALATLDARLQSTQASLAEKRVASDRLRANIAHNEAILVRIRNGGRLLLRAIQMRREFLG